MLVKDSYFLKSDYILAMVSICSGNSTKQIEISNGVYEIGHFGSSQWPSTKDYDHCPEFDNISCYGVCDHYEQILEREPCLVNDPDRKFIITITPILKANQEPDGGWRWHKWGEYIGTKNPQCEYLYDEPDIEKVYCYHIYERKN